MHTFAFIQEIGIKQGLVAQDFILLAVVLVSLAMGSYFFNIWIDTQIDNDPHGWYNFIYVAFGTAYTLLGALVTMGILFSWLLATLVIGVVFVCFAISGLPMMLGDMRRGARARQQAEQPCSKCGGLGNGNAG